MPELDGRLWFDVMPCDRDLLVRLHVRAPFAAKPQILERLLDFFRGSNDVQTLKFAFPEDREILFKLQRVMAGSTIWPRRVSELLWDEQYGHSVHVQI